MKFSSFRQKAFDTLAVLGLLAVTAGLVLYPKEMVASAREGVEMCFNVLIPSLFPFFVVSNLTVSLGLADRLGSLMSPVMEPLFNVGGPCAPALILGLIGGYPVGARTVINLYTSGKCSKAEAERLLAFCNNSGPAFILGVVGAGIFESSSLGVALYLIHMAASLLVGLVFRGYGPSRGPLGGPSGPPPAPLGRPSDPPHTPAGTPSGRGKIAAFVTSVSSAFTGCLGICGFVIFFTVLLRLLLLSGVMDRLSLVLGGLLELFGLDGTLAPKLLTGLVELTGGVWSLRGEAGTMTARATLAAFMLGWAGLSVHCQVISFLGETGLKVRTYLLGKLLHALLSAGLAAVVIPFVPVKTTVGTFLSDRIGALAAMDFSAALRASVLFAAAAVGIFLLSGFLCEKISGKKRGGGV